LLPATTPSNTKLLAPCAPASTTAPRNTTIRVHRLPPRFREVGFAQRPCAIRPRRFTENVSLTLPAAFNVKLTPSTTARRHDG
jgi:hypothetical protein